MANIETFRESPSPTITQAEHFEPRYVTPLADVLENDEHYLVLADMPGVSPENVSIELESNELGIEGKLDGIDGSPLVYKRTFRVGPAVDPTGITAELKEGVLHLTAKKNETQRSRQIAVKAG